MQTTRKDPLLGAAKVLVVLIEIIVIFAITMIGIGLGALLTVGRTKIMAEIAAAGAPQVSYPLVIIALVLVGAMLMLAHRFFRELRGIVDSVQEGEPFRIENADRLTRMGWISVWVHGLTLLLIGLSAWFAPYLHKADHGSDFGFEIEPTGLLLTLIIFILARVFRRGAEMREEIEGTV